VATIGLPHDSLAPWPSMSWPLARLGDALTALAKRAGLADAGGSGASNPGPLETINLPNWIEWAAAQLACEAQPLEIPLRELARELPDAYPSLLRFSDDSFLVVVGGSGNKLHVLMPALKIGHVAVDELCRVLREPSERSQRAEFERLLQETALPPRQQARTLRALLDEQVGGRRFDQCWIVRRQAGSRAFRSLRETYALRNGAGLLVAHTAQYLLWLLSWAILGRLSFSGHLDRGWMLAWALLLATLIPFQLLTTWLQGLFAIGLGAWLKRRLLAGALRLAPEELRRFGIGSFLGQAIEANSVEALAVSGGIAGVLAIVELVLAMFLLGRFAPVLAIWCALTIWIAWRFARRFENWTCARMNMTQDLVESMVGHRTRLAQQRREEWHRSEDLALDGYLESSRRVDGTGTWLAALIPRGWLLLGLACLGPSLVSGAASSSQTAILLGGILLAFNGFRKLTGSFADVAIAGTGWRRIRSLFAAAGRKEPLGEVPAGVKTAPGQKVIEADRLTFRYRTTGNPALRQCSVTIRKGERVLLEGPSGGGKTTLASLLSGLRQPESGLLLVNGLDRHTLGSRGWRQRVAAAPQFHENHILTETLAFNLLMGGRWPAKPQDRQEAEAVCRELGLGDLLDRMPGGMLQMIGEGGWQLSHGERSRVFIARALLQGADLVILDESFAALDPENLKVALEGTLRRAEALLVIAHP
jgi:ATP-binding cassette subfamily B protein